LIAFLSTAYTRPTINVHAFRKLVQKKSYMIFSFQNSSADSAAVEASELTNHPSLGPVIAYACFIADLKKRRIIGWLKI